MLVLKKPKHGAFSEGYRWNDMSYVQERTLKLQLLGSEDLEHNRIIIISPYEYLQDILNIQIYLLRFS